MYVFNHNFKICKINIPVKSLQHVYKLGQKIFNSKNESRQSSEQFLYGSLVMGIHFISCHSFRVALEFLPRERFYTTNLGMGCHKNWSHTKAGKLSKATVTCVMIEARINEIEETTEKRRQDDCKCMRRDKVIHIVLVNDVLIDLK